MIKYIEKYISKSIVVLVDQAVFSGGSFLITIMLARILGANNFGLYSSLTLFNYGIISLLNAVVIQPLQVSLGRITAKETYLSFNFWAQILLVLLIIVVTLLLSFTGLSIFENIKNVGIGFVIYSIGFMMHDYFRKLFLAKSEVYEALIIDCLTTFFNVLILAFAWFYHKLSFNEMVLYLGLAYVPALLLGVIIVKPHFKEYKEWVAFIKMHYEQGKWLLITTIIQWWSSNLFVVASGVFLGIKTLGAFRLVQSLFGVLNMLLQTFENYALPQATRLYIHSSHEAKQYLKKISSRSAMLFGVVLVLLFLFAKEVIGIAGGTEYLEYAFIVKGMAILYAFIFIGYPVRMAIRMLLLNRVFFTGYLLSFVFSLCSYHYLLKEWNVSGAIAGLIISQMIVLSYWQFILYKKEFILWK